VWLGRVASEVCRDEVDANHRKFLIQFWEPMNKKTTIVAKYRNC
jgi:hypothetical protein